jgi:hypothetical protein
MTWWRLPEVHAAMLAGVLDEPRARVFSDWTTELSGEQARQVGATLLPRAPELTTGQLIDQIKKLAITVDPDWANSARRAPGAVLRRYLEIHDRFWVMVGCRAPAIPSPAIRTRIRS